MKGEQTLSEFDDLKIIEAVRDGDTGRYRLIVERYKDQSFTLALRTLGNREEAEEAVQDAFLKAYKYLASFRGESKFSTWLYRILYNICMTKLSRKKRMPQSAEIEPHEWEQIDRENNQSHSPSSIIESNELSNLLLKEIGRLSQSMRVVITMYYVQEMSYKEISETTGFPIGTVKTHLFRGRNILKARMEVMMGEGELIV